MPLRESTAWGAGRLRAGDHTAAETSLIVDHSSLYADVVKKADQSGSAGWPADQAIVQTDAHHARNIFAFRVEQIKNVAFVPNHPKWAMRRLAVDAVPTLDRPVFPGVVLDLLIGLIDPNTSQLKVNAVKRRMHSSPRGLASILRSDSYPGHVYRS